MPLLVQAQVVGPGEAALTNLAGERLVAGVLAVVAGQFVASGEAPVAAFERALVRLLSCGKRTGKKWRKRKMVRVSRGFANRWPPVASLKFKFGSPREINRFFWTDL